MITQETVLSIFQIMGSDRLEELDLATATLKKELDASDSIHSNSYKLPCKWKGERSGTWP